MSGGPAPYLFGHSRSETERLLLQAELFAPSTRRFLEDAGITAGMRVLDVGTGAGDVALILAEVVGPDGEVVGLDANPDLIEIARRRVTAAHASFVVGDATRVEPPGTFDAVVGRCVLFFLPDPAATLRHLADAVRPGGIVAFQEPANATLAPSALPASPLLDQVWAWVLETYRRGGMDLHCGLRLHRHFLRAGLPAPAMHLDAAAGGGTDWAGWRYMAALIRTLLPLIVRHGVATEDDVAIDTLAERLAAEAGDEGSAVTWGFITASARTTAP